MRGFWILDNGIEFLPQLQVLQVLLSCSSPLVPLSPPPLLTPDLKIFLFIDIYKVGVIFGVSNSSFPIKFISL
jgi:hypothetical protein